jgi:hypothetical protein
MPPLYLLASPIMRWAPQAQLLIAAARSQICWTRRLASYLAPTSRQCVMNSPATQASTITSHFKLTWRRRDRRERRRRTFTFRGCKLLWRDTAAKVLAWADVFKEVGDVAASYDPQHFALPWAGVRLLLTVSHFGAHPSISLTYFSSLVSVTASTHMSR